MKRKRPYTTLELRHKLCQYTGPTYTLIVRDNDKVAEFGWEVSLNAGYDLEKLKEAIAHIERELKR